MNILSTISPIPVFRSNVALSLSTDTTPTPDPKPVPNPYNSRSDGFITTTLFGGITGKNVGKMLFSGDPQLKPEATIKSAMLQQTGINMGVGAAIYGGLSVLKQGIGLATGKQDAAGAMANITSDILRGGASGLGATMAGGLTGLAMKAIGSTGTVGTVVTFIGGMVGASIGANLLESTGVRDSLVDAFGSKKKMI